MDSLEFQGHVFSIKVKPNLSIREVSKVFNLSRDRVFRWTKKLEPCFPRCNPTTKIDMEGLRRDVEEPPDSFQQSRARRLNVNPSGMAWALKRLCDIKKPDASQGQIAKNDLSSAKR